MRHAAAGGCSLLAAAGWWPTAAGYCRGLLAAAISPTSRQGHLSLLEKDKASNTSEDMIANFEESADCKGHWIQTSVRADGTFTVTNGRNDFSKTYTTR